MLSVNSLDLILVIRFRDRGIYKPVAQSPSANGAQKWEQSGTLLGIKYRIFGLPFTTVSKGTIGGVSLSHKFLRRDETINHSDGDFIANSYQPLRMSKNRAAIPKTLLTAMITLTFLPTALFRRLNPRWQQFSDNVGRMFGVVAL